MNSQGDWAGEISQRAQELLGHVAATPVRIEILSIIADEQVDLRDLSDRLQSPRPTIRHNLGKMIEADLVEETIDKEYRCTPLGEAVLDGLDAFGDYVDAALTLHPLFSCSPTLDIDIHHLSDARVTEATRAKPHAPIRRLRDLIQDATTVHGYIPTNPFVFDGQNGSMSQDADCDVSLLVTEDVAEVLRAEYESGFDTVVDRDAVDIGVLSEPALGCGVAVIDKRAIILGLDENDKPHTLVETTNDSCRAWVREQIDQLQTGDTVVREMSEWDLPFDGQ